MTTDRPTLSLQDGPDADIAPFDTAPPAIARDEAPPAIHDVILGRLIGLDGEGRPLVALSLPGEATEIRLARAARPLGPAEVGRQVAMLLEGGDRRRPFILGLVWNPEPDAAEERPVDLALDGERLVLTADREIVLRCGEASITLTRAGKIVIRGTYLSSRSSGVNRIKGGSVQIN
jgi:hypothetical protein